MKRLPFKSWRNDAYEKVTGKAKYAADYYFVDMLHAVPVYSDFIHARIAAIESAAALGEPGVVAVLTGEDLPGVRQFGQIEKDLPLLAWKKIRYHGEPVALVVAATREQAIKAASLVRVDAKELPALLDCEKALEPDAPLLHEERGSNLINTHRVRTGDVEEGFRQAAFTIKETYTTAKVEHFYLEPEAAVCVPREDGVLEIYGSMQHPFSTRRFVAAYLGLPLSAVEIRSVPMGGGFGGKDDTAALVCARAALAALKCGRPVKIEYNREWSVRESYKRHSYRIRYEMGVDRDGRIAAVRCDILADGGAYASVTPWVTWRSTVQCCGPYRVDNVWCDVRGVYTNTVFTGAFRGFGSPQINFAVEQMVERAAEKAGISEIEFRRRNMVCQGDRTITGQILDGHVVSLQEVMEKVLKESGYEEKRRRSSFGKPVEGELYGIGLAISYRGMSLGAEGKDFCSAIINVQFDGSVLLEVAVHENGQGAEAAMIELLSRELGIARERIRYRRGSTSAIPDGGTTVASRATLMGGGAVCRAVEELKKVFQENLAGYFDCLPEQIAIANDRVRGPSGREISFEEGVQQLFLRQTYPYAFGVFQAPRVSWDEHTGQGKAYFTWVYGCQAVELRINAASGKVTLLNAWAAHDVGRVVNPGMLLGQYFGGMVMGMGYALMEEVVEEEGIIARLNLDGNRLMRSGDIPEMNAFFVENRDPQSPSGAKGIGEPAMELMAPAIANALHAATGKRFNRLPLAGQVRRWAEKGEGQ